MTQAMHNEKPDALRLVCDHLLQGDVVAATDVLEREYPFTPIASIERRSNCRRYTAVFLKDGFIDRYSGRRLVFPPALRILSAALPKAFPYHPNWKMDCTHIAYWELSATIDHVVPVSRGGADDESNWVTTSMLRNSAKGNFTLDELGWQPHSPGQLADWDGLLPWFLSYTEAHPEMVTSSTIRSWRAAADSLWKEAAASMAETSHGKGQTR